MKRMMKPWSCIVIGLVLWLTTLGQGIAAPDGENTPPAGPPAVPGQAAPDTPAPMTDIHDIHPPVPVGFDAPWLMPVLLTLAGVVILAALVWWWRRRRKQKKIETIVPELPPDMIANKALEEIGDVRGQDGKAFYFRLSAILRQYIWGRFGVGAPEMTTEEFFTLYCPSAGGSGTGPPVETALPGHGPGQVWRRDHYGTADGD